MDVSKKDVDKIRNKIFFHSKPAKQNKDKINKLHKKTGSKPTCLQLVLPVGV